jgi:hypothetical protein
MISSPTSRTLETEERGGARATRPAQVVVLGMHRSGTSAVTRVLNMMGLWVGPPDAFPPADEGNPTGYWEYREVWALNEAVLGALGSTWCTVDSLDLERLGPLARAHFERRARSVVATLDRGGSWVVKDPRLCILFPLWRTALERPLCVLIHRDPLAVALSLQERDNLPLLQGLALWELHNRRALAASQGLPRVLVSYRELVRDPVATARRLHRDLTRLAGPGAAGLSLPAEPDLRAFVTPSLDRHSENPALAEGLVNQSQADLQRSLGDGSALHFNPVPPLSVGAREVLSTASALARSTTLASRLGPELERTSYQRGELDSLLSAVFASRSWKLGAALTGLGRRLLGRKAEISAAERRERLLEGARRGLVK